MKIESMNLDEDKKGDVTDYTPDSVKGFYDIYFEDVNDSSEWRISEYYRIFKISIFGRNFNFKIFQLLWSIFAI